MWSVNENVCKKEEIDDMEREKEKEEKRMTKNE